MQYIVNLNYFGEICALFASICWSIAIIFFKSVSKNLSPILITAFKNSIGLFFFILFFLIFNIPIWYDGLSTSDYIKILISGALGMGFADLIFIYALSKIGANRIAIINCFEPAVIYLFSTIMLGTILNIQQLSGFIIVILSIVIISYEKNDTDIDKKTKIYGLTLQIIAIFLSSFGIVLIKPILTKISHSIEIQLWVTAFRLLPGFIVAWIVFSLQKEKQKLLKPIYSNYKVLYKILLSSILGTFIALNFWIVGYSNIEKPPIASIIGQTSVIFITILSWAVLKEKISKLRFLAMIIAIIGVILITIK